MTRKAPTPHPTIEAVIDQMRANLSHRAADFTLESRGALVVAAVANYGGTIAVRIGYEWVDEKHGGIYYGRAFVTRCTVSGIQNDYLLESFEPRSVEAAAGWLDRKAEDYGELVALAQNPAARRTEVQS
jgi:hypothetical protein